VGSWVVGYRCAVCGASVGVGTPHPWRCPNDTGRRHHVLRIVTDGPLPELLDHPSTLVAHAPRTAWWAFAAAHRLPEADRVALAASLDEAVSQVDGVGFRVTPTRRDDRLSAELGFTTGGVWVKDETGNVAGSHKARHLAGVLLHLLAAEALGLDPSARPPLAIASCGNAAMAAATLAGAVGWPIEVFVPPSANPWVLGRLHELGAEVVTCPRGPDSPPGDPCVHAFRAAVGAGAVPFSVQGPENALCLDTGRGIGWELAEQVPRFHRLVVQVGGGALATCAWDGLRDVLGERAPRLHAVQTEGCAPLARAWSVAQRLGADAAPAHWSECMWPWESEPHSVATGILDDETYDWLGIVQAMSISGGAPVVAPERLVVQAARLGPEVTGIRVDATGAAGLAGLLALLEVRDVAPQEDVAVLFTGRLPKVDRAFMP